jgi:hypothetical protein
MAIGWIREIDGGPELIRKAQERFPPREERTFAPTGQTIERGFGRHGYR